MLAIPPTLYSDIRNLKSRRGAKTVGYRRNLLRIRHTNFGPGFIEMICKRKATAQRRSNSTRLVGDLIPANPTTLRTTLR